MKGIVCEIGNHHFGDLNKAFELIKAAKDAGAHFVKMQAIDTEEFRGGSMPRAFYTMCDLDINGYMDCVDFAREVGIEIFFSVFGKKYRSLFEHYPDMPYKISGSQFLSMSREELLNWNTQDHRPVVISIPKCDPEVIVSKKLAVDNMSIMFVSPYLPEGVNFNPIGHMVDVFRKPIGYSDHTKGIASCSMAICSYGCQLIEKHFNIYGEQSFGGQIYRDSLHAASFVEMKALSKIYQERFANVPDIPFN